MIAAKLIGVGAGTIAWRRLANMVLEGGTAKRKINMLTAGNSSVTHCESRPGNGVGVGLADSAAGIAI